MPEFDSTLEYRDVPEFPGYRVGSDGSVWSGKTGSWKELKGSRVGEMGYRAVLLNATTSRKVHRLVLEAFVGPCPEGMVAAHHPDPNPLNCSLSNLRWATRKENEQDKFRQGRRKCVYLEKKRAGQAQRLAARLERKAARALLPSRQVLWQRKMLAQGRCVQCGKKHSGNKKRCGSCLAK